MFPEMAEGPKSTVIAFVLDPEAIVAPEGKLQTYPEAAGTVGIEYPTPL